MDPKELSFLPLSLNLTLSPPRLNPIPVNILTVNRNSTFQFLKSEADESLTNCTPVWRPATDGRKHVNGSLGYIIEREAVRK